MKNIILITALFGIIFSACKNEVVEDSNEIALLKSSLNINEPDIYRTLYPPSAKDIVSTHIITQIHEGLVKYDPKNLSVVEAIANKWDIDNSGKIYTFHLADSVYFHNDACFTNGIGRKITANDFYYTFQLLCTKNENNTNFYGTLDKVKGAKQYYEASTNGTPDFDIEGIKVINDNTIEITLEDENPLFIYFLANPSAVVLPKEGIDKYGIKNVVGAGPFYIEKIPEKGSDLALIKNSHYHMKDKNGIQLPYLDTINILFTGSVQKELSLFKEGKLDLVAGLPGKYVQEFLEANIQQFESNPPVFILNQSLEDTETEIFNLTQAYVKNFYTNRMNYIDLSKIYFEQPVKMQPDVVENETEES